MQIYTNEMTGQKKSSYSCARRETRFPCIGNSLSAVPNIFRNIVKERSVWKGKVGMWR